MKLKKGSKLVKKYLRLWSYRLGLRWWKIDIVFYDDPNAILEHFGGDTNITVLAVTYAEWKYCTGKILINLPYVCKLNALEIEGTVLHELCHLLLNEMREGEIHHEERVASTLQRAFFWTTEDVGANRGLQ